MAFDSFGAFVEMGGHGPYVWACYFVFFALMVVLIGWSKKQRKDALQFQVREAAPQDSVSSQTGAASFKRVDSSETDG